MQYSIVKLSETAFPSARIDAEHYRPVYVEHQNKLHKFGSKPLRDIVATPVKTGHTPSMKNEGYYGGHIRFIKTDNLRAFKVSGYFRHYLTESGNGVIERSELKPNDVIVTIIGATHKIVGRAALIREKDLPANINQNIALIRLKKLASPEFLSVYLNSKVGKFALWRLSRQTEQVNLNCREVEMVLVPEISRSFTNKIVSTYQTATRLEDESETLLTQAQNLLLSELGLADWQPKHKLSFEVNYSDGQQAGRIDADYFQPKYEEVVATIRSYLGGWDTLANLVYLKDKNFIPEDETEYKYIELANIAGNGEITDCTIEQGQDLPSRARRKVGTGDVIVSSIEGSLSSIALIDADYDQALCSTGFHVVNSSAFNSATLLVLLKSMVGQLQLKKGCSGTILTAINKKAFSQIVLPRIAAETQTQIQEKVTECFNLRQRSKHLLECAQRAVEMAIEEDEQTAIDWLETETSASGANTLTR